MEPVQGNRRQKAIPYVHPHLYAVPDLLFRAGARHPVVVCCLAGFLAGALLDIDHVPYRVFGIRLGYVPFGETFGLHEGRNLHGIALVLGGIGSACAGGYLAGMVLKARGIRLKVPVTLRPILVRRKYGAQRRQKVVSSVSFDAREGARSPLHVTSSSPVAVSSSPAGMCCSPLSSSSMNSFSVPSRTLSSK
jgi:hypothetical protein